MAIQIEGQSPVDIEEAITAAGNGKFQHKVIFIGGCCLFCSYIAISGVSFVLPTSQCDLQMNSQDKGNLISAGFLGIALSCHLWGFLSDTFGRHYILSRCLLADGLLYIVTSITPNYAFILIWRFCNGFASCGGIVSLYAYIGEFHSNKTRLRALMFTSLLASFLFTLLPVFAWLILPGKWSFLLYPGLTYKSWRLFYACNGVPSLICSFMLRFLPESPKFLMAKGENEKALRVLQRIHRENSKNGEQETFWVKSIVLNESEKVSSKPVGNSNKVMAFGSLVLNQTIPLFQSPHRFCMVIVCLTQFLLYLSNGGIYLWLPETLNRLANFKNDCGNKTATYCEVVQYQRQEMQLQYSITDKDLSLMSNNSVMHEKDKFFPDDIQQTTCIDDIDFSVYLLLEILSISNSLALAVCVILSSFFDKKYVVEFCIVLSLICAVSLLAINIIQIIPIPVALIIVSSGTAIPIINSIAVDLFPTNLRAMASCFTLMCSRFGTVTANALAGSFIDSHCVVLNWCFIGSFIVSLFLIMLLPKTPPYMKDGMKITEDLKK